MRRAVVALVVVSLGAISLVAAAKPEVYFEACGKGPALVLIHGGQLDSRMWDREYRRFCGEFRVIRYDVRNFGKSPLAVSSYSDVEDLRALLKHVGVKRATLVGLSLGGSIALDFAAQYPSLVDKLVLAGTGLSQYEWSESLNQEVEGVTTLMKAGKTEAATEKWLQSSYLAPAGRNAALAGQLRRISRDNARAWTANFSLRRKAKRPAITHLAQIAAPTLILIGKRDVPDLQSIAKLLVGKMPNARRVELEDVGHMVNMEAPEKFEALVREFLRR